MNIILDVLKGAPPFILLIGILVFVHELGHFLAAKWCGMRADVFAIGMGPRLFGWNKITGFTFGKLPADLDLGDDTDFRLAVFPIGGYVKIAGMVDESMDVDFTTHKPQPWEFRSKNALQKAFVISAGVIMNFLLAIVVFSGINFFNGRDVRSTTTIGPLPIESPAYAAGMRAGDKILSINGAKVESFDDIQYRTYIDELGNDLKFEIVRDGSPQTIVVKRDQIKSINSDKDHSMIPNPEKQTVLVSDVVVGSAAAKAGIKGGDVIIKLDSSLIGSTDQMRAYSTAHPEKDVAVTVLRADKPIDLVVRPSAEGLIGVKIGNVYKGPTKNISYNVGSAIVDGTSKVWNSIKLILNLVSELFRGKASVKESLGGPSAVAKQAYESWSAGAAEFIATLGLLSVMLGFMNILPIPALDGGHLVFIIIEAVIRREVSVKVRMVVQQVGVAVLLLFMLYVTANDFAKMLGLNI